MGDRDPIRDSTGMIVRSRAPAVVWSRADRYRERLDRSKLRLREAMTLVKESARELTPMARIESNPIAWVVGGLLFGLALGWVTATPRQVRE